MFSERQANKTEQLREWRDIAVWAAQAYIVGSQTLHPDTETCNSLFSGALVEALELRQPTPTPEQAQALNNLANDCLRQAHEQVTFTRRDGVIRPLFSTPPIEYSDEQWSFYLLMDVELRRQTFPGSQDPTAQDYNAVLARITSELL